MSARKASQALLFSAINATRQQCQNPLLSNRSLAAFMSRVIPQFENGSNFRSVTTANRLKPGINLVQPVHTTDLTKSIKKVTLIREASLIAMNSIEYMNPQQVVDLLRRLPFLMRHEYARLLKGQTLDEKVPMLFHGILHMLGDRLALQLDDCSLRQIEYGAWAMAASRHEHDSLALALSAKVESLTKEILSLNAKHFNSNVVNPSPTQLNSGAFTSATLIPERIHLLPTSSVFPEINALAGIAWSMASISGSGSNSVAAVRAAATGLAEAIAKLPSDPKPLPDAESICRLAWTLAKAEVDNPAAIDRILHWAEIRIQEQLENHDPACGPLQPKCTFRYKTFRGWSDQGVPRDVARLESKYLRDTAPMIIPRDFEVDSIGSILSAVATPALRRQVHPERLEKMLALAAQHVAASAVTSEGIHPMEVSYKEVTRILAACEALEFRSSTMVTPLLHGLPMASLSAAELAALAAAAAVHRVRSKTVFFRILRAFNAKLGVIKGDQQGEGRGSGKAVLLAAGRGSVEVGVGKARVEGANWDDSVFANEAEAKEVRGGGGEEMSGEQREEERAKEEGEAARAAAQLLLALQKVGYPADPAVNRIAKMTISFADQLPTASRAAAKAFLA